MGRPDADEWTAQAVTAPDHKGGSAAHVCYDSPPEGFWVLVQQKVGFPDELLQQFYAGPAKNCKEINLYAAAVWGLYMNTKQMILKEMQDYDVSLGWVKVNWMAHNLTH
jgi:hypothetical protein